MERTIDDEREAARIRKERPARLSLNPDPRPTAGEIRVMRRRDGSYRVATLDYDDQAAELPDGSLAVEVVLRPLVHSPGESADALAGALRRAHDRLNELRLTSAMEFIAALCPDRDEDELVALLRAALAHRS